MCSKLLKYSILLSLGLEVVKYGLKPVFEKLRFEKIFNEAIDLICKKNSNLEKIHLDFFFSNSIVEEEVKKFQETGISLDFQKLIDVFQKYLDGKKLGINAEEVLKDIFSEIERRIPTNLFERIEINYLKDIQNCQKVLNAKLDNFQEINKKLLDSISEFKIDEEFDTTKNPHINVFNKLKQISTTLNSRDPYYEHAAQIDSNGVKYSLKPRNKEALKKQPLRFSLTVKIKKKDGRIITLQELLKKSITERKEVILRQDDIIEIKIFKGDTLLLSSEAEEIQEVKISSRVPPPRPVKILIPNSNSHYDNIFLNVVTIDEDQITLSNFNQKDFPIFFKMILNRKDNMGTLDLHPNFSMGDIYDAWQFEKFFFDLNRINKIAVFDIKKNKPLFIANYLPSYKIQSNKIILEFYRKAVIIQQVLDIKLPWPTIISQDDMITINDIFNAISEGIIILKNAEFDIPIENNERGKQIIDSLIKFRYVEGIEIKQKLETSLFGVKIEFNGKTKPFKIKPKNDPKEIIKKFNELIPGKKLIINFESIPEDKIEFHLLDYPKSEFKELEKFYSH
jgi:hypothetical protein